MTEVRFVAEQLNRLMLAREINDQELADATGIGRTTIYYLRNGRGGKNVATSIDRLAKIAAYFGVSTEHFLEESDSTLVQKKMSALVADIADVAEHLPPSRQRELRELGKMLAKLDQSKDVDAIYTELMDLVLRLSELEGGSQALRKLMAEIESLATRGSSGSVKGRTRQRRTTTDTRKSSQKGSQSDQ